MSSAITPPRLVQRVDCTVERTRAGRERCRRTAARPSAVRPRRQSGIFSNRVGRMSCSFLRVVSGGACPCTAAGGGAGEIRKVAGAAAERAHHTIGGMRVAPVQRFARDGGEDIADEVPTSLRDIGMKLL